MDEVSEHEQSQKQQSVLSLKKKVSRAQSRRLERIKRRGELKREKELERKLLEQQKKREIEIIRRDLREKVLRQICNFFKKAKRKMNYQEKKQRAQEQWEDYINCEILKTEDPHSVYKYIYLLDSKEESLEQISQRYESLIPFFETFMKYIENPLNLSDIQIQNIMDSSLALQSNMAINLNNKCFQLINNVENNFNVIDFYRREFNFESEHIKIRMWAYMQHPLQQNHKIELQVITFLNSNVVITLPLSYSNKPIIVRVVYLAPPLLTLTWKARTFKMHKIVEKELIDEIMQVHSLRETLYAEIVEAQKKNVTDIADISTSFIEASDSLISEDSIKLFEMKSQIAGLGKKGGSTIRSVSLQNVDHTVRPKAAWDMIYQKAGIRSASVKSSISSNFEPFSRMNAFSSFISVLETPFQMKSSLSYNKRAFQNKRRRSVSFRSFEEDLTNIDITLEGEIQGDYCLDLLFPYCESIQNKFGDEVIKPLKELVELFPTPEMIKTNEVSTLTLDEMYTKREGEIYETFVNSLKKDLSPGEVNMRAYHVIGGTYLIEFSTYLPVVTDLKSGCTLIMHNGAAKFKIEPLIFDYNSNVSIENGIPFSPEIAYTGNLKNLISVEIQLVNTVLLNTSPQPVQWDQENEFWTTNFIHDIHYNNSKKSIFFRIEKGGIFGMALYKFVELPFKEWILSQHKEIPNCLVLTLHCQHVLVEFQILGAKVCLNVLEGVPKNIVDNILGKYMLPQELIFKMKSFGLDVFPENDSFLYVHNIPSKPLELESFVCMTIALFSQVLEYKSSKWNLAFGRNEILFQGCKGKSNFLTFRTDIFNSKAIIIDEEDSIYTEHLLLDEDVFTPDLYSLFSKLFRIDFEEGSLDVLLTLTTYTLLLKTKVLTFSGNSDFIL